MDSLEMTVGMILTCKKQGIDYVGMITSTDGEINVIHNTGTVDDPELSIDTLPVFLAGETKMRVRMASSEQLEQIIGLMKSIAKS